LERPRRRELHAWEGYNVAKAVLLLIGVSMLAPGARAADLPQPISEASAGKLQCYNPDRERRTCQSLAGYALDPAGKILNTATVLISGQPLITMETVSEVIIKDGQVCGAILRKDIDNARIVVNGQQLPRGQAEPLRQQIVMAFEPALGHEICTRYVRQADAYVASATDNGKPMEPETEVLWVAREDGWRVAP
jgi:hypothetical protein